MNTFLLFVFVALVSSAAAAPAKSQESIRQSSHDAVLKLQENIRQAGGCNVNVCFALDGSGSVSRSIFEIQKTFVLDVSIISAVLEASPSGSGPNFAAVQYADRIETISPLTNDLDKFILEVDNTTSLNGPGTNITGAINRCADLLFGMKGAAAEKIILLSDGRSNLGGDPVLASNRFRENGGDIYAVEVGSADITKLLDIVGGAQENVFRFNDYFEIVDKLCDS